MKQHFYQPNLSIYSLYESIILNNNQPLLAELSEQSYERLCLERVLLIALDIYNNENNSWTDISLLDIGCNNGLVSTVLYILGCRVTGIDNMVIDTQGLYNNLNFTLNSNCDALNFQQIDLLPFLKTTCNRFDYSLLLSVSHHWEPGYALSGKSIYSKEQIEYIMNELYCRTNKAIYYECPSCEAGFENSSGITFLQRYLRNNYDLKYLGKTIGPNGFLRDLIKIIVKG